MGEKKPEEKPRARPKALYIAAAIIVVIVLAALAYILTLPKAPQVAWQLPLPPDARRGDVLVIENHHGTHADPQNFNRLVPGRPGWGATGYSQVCAGALWYINTTNSELISWLAAGPPEYSPDYREVTIYLRKGITWSDGVPFTADDVVFHINLIRNTQGLFGNAIFKKWVADVSKVDDYTVKVKLTEPNPRFHLFLTVVIYGSPYNGIVPKHIWEKEDPLKFKFYPPVCLGPYVLKQVDPGGNWFLWERNENWWGTRLYGMKPAPKYVLFIHHGPEDKKALAMSRHELDAIRTFLPENFQVVWQNNKYIGGWRKEPPFAWLFDACVKGIAFNLQRYPYNITEVRLALRHVINFKAIYEAFEGPDGSLPSVAALPVVPTPLAVKLYYEPLESELVKLGYDPSIKWWKYDPEKAARLLESVGFKKGPDGKWRLPNGEKWVINIIAPSGFEMESQRIAFLVADQWKAFDIEVNVNPVETGVFSPSWSRGTFDVGAFWPGCSLLADLTPHIQWWHSKYFDPSAPSIGWAGYSFPKRDLLNSIIDEMERTPSGDPKIYELGREALLIWAEQAPWIGFFPTPFYTLNDNYVWTNWPHYPDNYYMDPVYWWAQMQFIILQLKPTGNVERLDKTMPGKPPVLPIEIPKKP
ncbi:ABC transporter substrate-binding protein [Infirmifilum lucidum]|uniref:ABC transporter substrate-binding protein n=1 Tax=Infirmifilum lucidum TaxID=2776706 RepID=A0A7L9FG96_9CREN|nr:ABC transporter substrate-binding protein [Infirmifilum lucidum]QOJ78838.1 ABC transporter substrate-binding protein [Infirmifilum lucidum]